MRVDEFYIQRTRLWIRQGSRRVLARIDFMKRVGLAMFVIAIVLLVFPASTLAVTTLVWGNIVENPDGGGYTVEDPVNIQHGGTYAVPFNISKDVQVQNDNPSIFNVEGVLFYIPDPEESTREFVEHVGGYFGAGTLTWERAGVYELDVYEMEPPIPTLNPFSRFLAWLLGTPVHAQNSEHFLETIRFTIAEEGVVQECCSNVLFLPGIKGSILKSGSDTLWPPTVFSDDVRELVLDGDGNSVNDVFVDGIVNTAYGTSIYAPFSAFMDSLVNDGTISAWRPLPYDWRFSPQDIVKDGIKTPSGTLDVIHEVETLAAQSQTGKVTIIAHSMGGLVGKALIKKLEEEGKDNLIDSFVMVGVPQLGTPQAAAALLHGDDEGLGYGFIARASDIRSVAQNMPGAYSLLPSSRYFGEVTAPVITFNTLANFTEPWRNFWGIFINTYAKFAEFVTGQGVSRTKPPEGLLRIPEVLRPHLVEDAADFHALYDNYEFPDHIRVVQIAGWGRPTVKEIEYAESHGVPSYKTRFTVEGDKTVVYPSAISSAVDETYFFDIFHYNRTLGSNAQHGDLLNAGPIRSVARLVIEELSTSEVEFISTEKPQVENIEDQLIISTHSPVVLGAYDELGNFTGINPNQELSADVLSITEGIPGSTFLYTSESQYIFVPKNGTYTFVYKGIGNGSTTVIIEEFSNETTTQKASYSDVPTTGNTSATFALNGTAPEEAVIKLDVDGDGDVDEEVLADGTELTLEELIALLKQKIQALDAKNKLKKNLLKKVEDIEKKMVKDKKKKAEKAIKIVGKQVSKGAAKAEIDAASAEELLRLLEQIESAL